MLSFGKTMENILNGLCLLLFENYDEKRIFKAPTILNFNRMTVYYKNYSSYAFKNNVLELSKPIYFGSCILEFPKLLMYETYYDKLQKYYGDKIQLHYTDCDSFVMSAQTDDIVKDLKETYKMYDFHNLDSSHELYDNRLEKIPGYLK